MIELRDVMAEDARLLWEWANDPAVRASAFSNAPITWEEHAVWFHQKLSDQRCRLYVVMEGATPIGQVRFDIQPGGPAVVDMHIAAPHRGHGHGPGALRLACERLATTSSVRDVFAQVKLDNAASLRAFERAGFVSEGKSIAHGVEVMTLRWSPHHSAGTFIIPSVAGQRRIGVGLPTYIVAEMSANHGGDFDRAVKLIEAAQQAGADAIKLQTYTPDTMTIKCRNEHFQIKGTVWNGANLYELYGQAYTPWEWQPKLREVAHRLGLDFFSTPFDASAVEFLETLCVPLYKVASFESIDVPLLRRIAATKKPVIISTGMATLEEIQEAVRTVQESDGGPVALLKCTSAYPARPHDMHLRTIAHMIQTFGVPIGVSDHTLEPTVPLGAVALGACILEKHLTLSRAVPSPDSAFSLEPQEFRAMVESVRTLEEALGTPRYGPSEAERESLMFRRSLFIVKDVNAGERLTPEHVRCIRPGGGLHPRHIDEVIGRRARQAIVRGTPLSWELIEAPPL